MNGLAQLFLAHAHWYAIGMGPDGEGVIMYDTFHGPDNSPAEFAAEQLRQLCTEHRVAFDSVRWVHYTCLTKHEQWLVRGWEVSLMHEAAEWEKQQHAAND